MTAVKERIIGAVSIMSDKDANIFWHIIQKHFKLPDTFADIEKVEPDETDLIMLKEIENNPDCHEFISQEELMKELNMKVLFPEKCQFQHFSGSHNFSIKPLYKISK